ncbi:sensor histidine kinase [Neobacillus ginsengisoli]|uniref:histidine kinase n=1 Tax=Neobacillus ginsengisoli TaxID=904295 RepID=A0ABT9XTN0_9BACI|nr:histidine kinase [Neobacillus ginsengisoli]MDQ0198706.1 two-component system sensor histidine kinase YesM [Neobacillus ginsengisoli]
MKQTFKKFAARIKFLFSSSIRTKMVLFFLMVALIPLVLFGFLSYEKSSNIVNKQYNDYEQFAVSQLDKQIENTFEQMYVVSKDINHYLSDPTLIILKEEIPRTYKGFIENKNFERFLEAHKTFNTKGIYLITNTGYYYGNDRVDIHKLFQKPFWRGEINSLKEGDLWIGFYRSDHYYTGNKDEKLMGLVLPVESQFGVLKGSKLLIETNAEELFSYINFLEKNLHASITLKNGKHQVVYKTKNAPDDLATDIVWNNHFDAYGWDINVRIPQKYYYQSSNVIYQYTLFAILFSIILASFLAVVFSVPLAKRIKNLKSSMERVSKGNLNTQIAVTSKDELGILAQSFNDMVNQIKELIDQISQTERLKRQAELRAFHYQINPHLLFNTLNSIQWKARLLGAKEVQEMIYHLTEVLQENLNFADELIPLRKELQTIKHYLKVQEVRYGHTFEYIERIQSECLDYLIPRMTLQPLFENIFFHAFEDGQGRIELVVTAEPEYLELTLADDGKGMNDETIKKLLDPNYLDEKGKGIGVYNVDQRVKLHFGTKYGLSIESIVGMKTIFRMRWPKRR